MFSLSEGQIAIAVSLIGLLGQGLNLYLKARIQAEMREMELRILDRVQTAYASRDRVDGLEARLSRLEAS